MQGLYIFLCLVGTVLPLSQFIPWLVAHGLDVPLLLLQATASPVAAFAWSDVLISGITVAIFIGVEGRRQSMRHWGWSLCALVVGPSLALPLFLLLRERHLAARQRDAALSHPP